MDRRRRQHRRQTGAAPLTPRSPRIVIFSAGIAEPGGAARRSRLIVEGLADRGWQVRVVTRAGTINRFHLRRSPGITILEVPGFGRRRTGAVLFLLCAFPLGLVWGRRASSFMAIQLLSQATVAAICSLILRRPYIALATTSGEQVSEVRYILTEGRFRGLRRWLLRRASFLIGQTPEAARQLEAFLPAERVAVLPNPVAPVDAPRLNGLRHAIYTGRFSEEKDLPTLLEAWEEVASDSPGSTLTLVGEGGSYRSVEAELRGTVARTPALSSTVRFTGWVSEVGPFLSEADVYVLPSLDRGNVELPAGGVCVEPCRRRVRHPGEPGRVGRSLSAPVSRGRHAGADRCAAARVQRRRGAGEGARDPC